MTDTLRDSIRGKILATQEVKKIRCTFFGTEVELRQPTLKEILKTDETADKTEQAISMIIKYCYVPGTEERVFEAADKDVLLSLPFGEDFVRIQKAIATLTEINVTAEVGN